MKSEQWKAISGFEGRYEVSNLGRVRNVKTGRTLKPYKRGKGYLGVTVSTGQKPKSSTVHRLVASAFITNPRLLPSINHKNGIKTDNRVENLEWCTTAENNAHAKANGLYVGKKGKEHPLARLTESDISRARQLRERGEKLIVISKLLGVGISHTFRIVNGQAWAHIKPTL